MNLLPALALAAIALLPAPAAPISTEASVIETVTIASWDRPNIERDSFTITTQPVAITPVAPIASTYTPTQEVPSQPIVPGTPTQEVPSQPVPDFGTPTQEVPTQPTTGTFGPIYQGPATQPHTIQEDDPGWDCHTMGNLICGP